MPGLMSLRPMAATGKASRRTSRLSEKLAEERERAGPPPLMNLKAGAIDMPVFKPAAPISPHLFRAKQVTDPWPANVRARLVGSGMDVDHHQKMNYSASSGSEHEPSSNCLAAMVHEFMEKEESGKCGRARCNCESGSCNGGDAPSSLEDFESKSSLGGELAEVLQGLAPCVNEDEAVVLAEAIKAMDAVSNGTECASNVCRRRSVMKHLRGCGYNAALCKSRWDHAGSFPGGDYEYIDVVFPTVDGGPQARLIVDIDFQAQFEIARPTSQYKHVYQALPSVYVGTTDRLLQIVNVMTEAVKRSLKKKGMLLPPWRKPEYVKAKWFSSYKRTTNEASQRKQADHPNISLVAVRSIEWDKNFTTEMERELFEKNSTGSTNLDGESKAAVMKNIHFVDRVDEEKAVNGANRLKHMWADMMKSDSPREIEEIDNLDWELPALLPKALNRRSQGSTAGLTSVLREAGLIGSNLGSSIRQDFKAPVAAM